MLLDLINSFRSDETESAFIETSIKDMKRFSGPPGSTHPNTKILTIIACHTNTNLKLKTILNNIRYFRFINNYIIVINSSDTKYSKELETACNVRGLKYIEIPNNSHLDVGKWMHVLKTTRIDHYNFVVFTNDSYVINNPICHFYNKMAMKNVELYGYNDSTQITHHYQSYLFGVKREAINKFILHYESHKNLLTDYLSVVSNIELKLMNVFKTKDCFLKIGNLYHHKAKNIFFNNDKLYIQLMKPGLLPFFKLKRVIGDKTSNYKIEDTPSSHNTNISISI
jgi:hypothetical protein